MKSEQEILTELAVGEFHFNGGCSWVKKKTVTRAELEQLVEDLKSERHIRNEQFAKNFDAKLGSAIHLLLEFLSFTNKVSFRWLAQFESLAEVAQYLDRKAVQMTSNAAVSDLLKHLRTYNPSRFGKREPGLFGGVQAFQELQLEDPGAGPDRMGG